MHIFSCEFLMQRSLLSTLTLRSKTKQILKSFSVKKGCAKSKKTLKFGAGAIFNNCTKVLTFKAINYKDKLMLK